MRTIILCALLGFLAGWEVSLLLPDEWVSETIVRLAPWYADQMPDADAQFGRLADAALSEPSLGGIIEFHDLYAAERASGFTADSARRMRDAIRVRAIEFDGRRAYRLSFRYRQRLGAMNALQDVVMGLRQNASTLPRTGLRPVAVTAGFDPDLVQLLDTPTLAETPSLRHRVEAPLTGLCGGLLLGVLLTRLRRKRPLQPAEA